jgi:predicted nucleic acid-binding Zn ribbon protein
VARTRDPKKISEVVCEMCRSMGFTEAYNQYKTLQIWHLVVGEAISAETRIERFLNGELFIKVKNPSWRMELNFRKQDIIKKLNEALEKPIVEGIIFK